MCDSKNTRIYFTITIDVEADNVWEDPSNLSTRNLETLPRFQDLCARYEVVPTYLLSYETLYNTRFINFVKKVAEQGECEVTKIDISMVKKIEFSKKF